MYCNLKLKSLITIFLFQVLSVLFFNVQAWAVSSSSSSSLSLLFHVGTDGHIVKTNNHGVIGQCLKKDRNYSCDKIKIDIRLLSSKEKSFLDQIQKVLNYPSESFFEINDIKGNAGNITSGLLKIGQNSYPISEGEYFPEDSLLVLSFRMQLSKIGVKTPLNFQDKLISDDVSWVVSVPYK